MNLPKQIGIPNVERVLLLILVRVFKQQVSIKFSNDASIFHPKSNNSL
jgi:hypothetical protein